MGANKNRWDCPWMDILMLMSSLFVEAVGHLLNIFIYVRLCACICINYRSRMRFVGMVSASSVGVRTLLFGWRWWTGCIRVGSVRCWLSTHRLAAAVIECIHRSSRSVSTAAAAAAAATNHPLLKLDAAAVWSAVSIQHSYFIACCIVPRWKRNFEDQASKQIGDLSLCAFISSLCGVLKMRKRTWAEIENESASKITRSHGSARVL